MTSISTINQRLIYLAMLATVVFFGYALTPGLGSPVANTDLYILAIYLNKFTSPGMILVVFNLSTVAGMMTLYDGSIQTRDVAFIFLNFNARGILSVFETVNIPLFLQVTGSDPESVDAVTFRHSLSDVNWVQLGFLMLLAGNLILVVMPVALSFPHLAVAEFLVWSVGCPITTAVVVAAFSKLLSGRPQGTPMGLLGSAASVSLTVLPLLPAAIPTLTLTKTVMLDDVEYAFRIASPSNDLQSPLGSDKADFPAK
ncbi:unnamed protein product [Peronospora destructor]|uniref:Uncharacterized protein n=1 Tax=Peronospora destructor TaxID=86335 RepID=A0AAV0TFR9_9STRA|nr:unnamed protein product [Peronospora destructor]